MCGEQFTTHWSSVVKKCYSKPITKIITKTKEGANLWDFSESMNHTFPLFVVILAWGCPTLHFSGSFKNSYFSVGGLSRWSHSRLRKGKASWHMRGKYLSNSSQFPPFSLCCSLIRPLKFALFLRLKRQRNGYQEYQEEVSLHHKIFHRPERSDWSNDSGEPEFFWTCKWD